MKVIELSKQGGVTPHVVRFYVRKGLLRPQRLAHNRYQVFSRDDLTRIKLIRALQALGYTLAEISKALDDIHEGRSPMTWMVDVIERRAEEVARDVRDLQSKRDRMSGLLTHWRAADQQEAHRVRSIQDLTSLISAHGA